MLQQPDMVVPDYLMGELPLALGTSLALEQIKNYEQVVARTNTIRINLETLIRNSHDAIKKELLTTESLIEHVLSDIRNLKEIIPSVNSNWNIQFYVNTATYYRRMVSKAVMRLPKTQKQKDETLIIAGSISKIVERAKMEDVTVESVDGKTGTGDVCIMLTHLPTDLLCRYEYKELLLLESNTGALKNDVQWGSKLVSSNRRDYARHIPFIDLSFIALGDGNKKLSPFDRTVSKSYYELARLKNWGIRTTRDKVIHDITNSEFKEVLKPILPSSVQLSMYLKA